jgi:cell wall-associated NlpC family hydrolase
MRYHAAGDRCIFEIADFSGETLPLALAVLRREGFVVDEPSPDPVTIARSMVGQALFSRCAVPDKDTPVFSCHQFVKWCFGRVGIWLPYLAVEQRAHARKIAISDVRPGDLVFNSGYRPRYLDDPNDGVGQVGIVTAEDAVVHCTSRPQECLIGVVETSMAVFFREERYARGACRVLPDTPFLTVRIPDQWRWRIETSGDLTWFIRGRL